MSSFISQFEYRPARDATRTLVALLIAVFAPCTSFGQAVLPGADVRVSDSLTMSPPEISLGTDGIHLLSWGRTAQWIAPAGQFVRGNVSAPDTILMPFVIGYPEFAYVSKTRDDCKSGTMPYYGFVHTYRYNKFNGVDTSAFSGVITEEYDCREVVDLFAQQLSRFVSYSTINGAVCLTLEELSVSDLLPVQRTGKCIIVDATMGTAIHAGGYSYYGGFFFTWDSAGSPRLYLSARHEDEMLLNQRRYENFRKSYSHTTAQYYNTITRTLSGEFTLDSASEQDEYRRYYPRLTDSTICLFYEVAYNDTLFADIFTRSGALLEAHKAIAITGKSDSLSERSFTHPGFTVATPPGDTMYVAWTRWDSGGGADVYIRAFNGMAEPVSDAKRINADTTGISSNPVVAYENGEFVIAWLRYTSPDDGHIYTKRVTTQEITPVASLPAPGSFAIRSLYPQPVHSLLTIQASVAVTGVPVSLYVYSVMGSAMHSQTVDGSRDIHIDCSAYPQGIYFVTLRQGASAVTSLFLVRR